MKRKNRKNKHTAFPAVVCTVFLAAAVLSGNAVYRRQQIDANIITNETADASDPILVLVNRTHIISDEYSGELVELDCGKSVDSRIYPDLQAMFDEMRSEGIYPIVNEGFRTRKDQQQMMTDQINAYLDEGYSRRKAEKLAEKIVAPVGSSEHELGIAVDIIADKAKSDNETIYNWLAENAYKYGFILRYPPNKTEITGIDYEPWHYRYVGKKAAAEIYEQGICLEEYLENNTKGTDI